MSYASKETNTPASEVYQQRMAAYAEQRAHFQELSNRNGNLNVLLAGVALICLLVGIWHGGAIWFIGAVLGAAAFIASFVNHIRLDDQRRRYDDLYHINQEGLFRLQRDWKKLPLRQARIIEPQHPYAADLDLRGHASVQHLLNTVYTPIGQQTLQQWLLHPASPTVVQQRQLAVRELIPLVDFREELAFSGKQIQGDESAYATFLEWAEGQPWLLQRPWLIWLSRISAGLTVLLIIAQVTGIIQRPLWGLGVLLNLAIAGVFGGRIKESLGQVAEKNAGFQSYSKIFGLIANEPFNSPALQQLQMHFRDDHNRADERMRQLAVIMSFAQMGATIIFAVLQLTTLWTFQVLWFLENWQQQAGMHARDWLETLGELEALSALATLAYEQPEWTFPNVQTNGTVVFAAKQVAHPLLPPQRAVGNDVTIGPGGTFLLVTGSNMSGKSTLLRAIGSNIVLAQMGGPVNAAAMDVAPITIATSIRIQDSLEDGISYFMAELNRLKVVVEQSHVVAAENDTTLLFLLDEILHGTNTSERRIAARYIITYLLAAGATGAVSTHDLELADAPDFAATSQRVHFTENFTRDNGTLAMTFDYHLRDGLATSTNALKLMEMVGLLQPEEVS